MRLSTLALSALILAVPGSALAQADNHAGGMHDFFTPEQREIYMEQNKMTDWSSMTKDQRHAEMQTLRTKFEGMSDADKTKLRADMQSKYDAMTPDQKQAVEAKIAEHRAHRQQMMQGGQSQ